VKQAMFILCRTRQVSISTEATGIGSTGITGSGLPFTADLGYLLGCLLFQGLLWLYRLIIFSVCRRDIIGYITATFIATGGIGVVIATGAGTIGIEIIPGVVGVAENFIGRRRVIVAEMFTERVIFTERRISIERPMLTGRLMFTERLMLTGRLRSTGRPNLAERPIFTDRDRRIHKQEGQHNQGQKQYQQEDQDRQRRLFVVWPAVLQFYETALNNGFIAAADLRTIFARITPLTILTRGRTKAST